MTDMASTLLRRNSSKQGLQNLLRVTTQRSIEDAEEIERERRRRAREAFRQNSGQASPGGASSENGLLAEDSPCDRELKPASQLVLEEDEGFSDWTQKLVQRRQQCLDELEQARNNSEHGQSRKAVPANTQQSSALPASRWRQQEEEEELRKSENRRRKKEQEEAVKRQEEVQRQQEREPEAARAREEEERSLMRKREEEQSRIMEEKPKEKRKEVKVSFTSKVFLQQEVKHVNGNGDAAGVEVASLAKTKRVPRSQSQAQEADEEAEVFLETEQKLEKIRRSHQEKESQELELLRQRQMEAEVELEELKRRREERRRLREEEERRKEEEEHQRQLKEEEEKRRMKEDIEKRRMEAAERRMKTLSISSTEGDEPFCPLSPKSSTMKISGRTESLNRSLKKSNSVKKTQPPVLITKIDDRLEQYSHAIETSSKDSKASKQALMDIPSPPEPIACKKSLFEAGEAWNQNPNKCAPLKDAEGLKVGVADLITQWVKGSVDGSNKTSPSKSSDIKAGDVLHKKNMWETIGDTSSGGKPGPGAKTTPSGKRYKFIVTGHGKYEKVPVNDIENDYANGNSGVLCQGEF
ncbi:non-muscle caldesmon isoform X2 [Brienomyrus brachyistius]|uniref:non-muscle caldesmon isoform X2 n=1 Tax=Brienomyrus brachyistius TaxID=42636 RepID=UPI0020B1DAE7|nr:non-muscle caldesmon isoform X2 [Brienomyrus brachyistius]